MAKKPTAESSLSFRPPNTSRPARTSSEPTLGKRKSNKKKERENKPAACWSSTPSQPRGLKQGETNHTNIKRYYVQPSESNSNQTLRQRQLKKQTLSKIQSIQFVKTINFFEEIEVGI